MKTITNSLFVTGLLAMGAAVSALPVYESSFESGEGFSVGDFPTTVDRWTVEEAPVSVEGSGAQVGSQFVRLGSGAILDFSLTGSDTEAAGDVVWVEGYFRGAGSDTTLANANYPLTAASAIVHFSSANGIEVWDGSQVQGSEPTSLGVALGTDNQDTWFKITIQLTFGAESGWEIWVNDEKKNSEVLGFRDNTVTSLNGFKNLAQGGADFDGFRIVAQIAGDANGDGAVDAADITRLIEYIANPPSGDPILMGNLDIAGSGDGQVNQDDLVALNAHLTGMM